ncbi:sigma-54-dependent transcriptional regulator [Desulfobacterota bacterium M19]
MADILIIDDELSMREFLKVLLEREGYGADTAANAQDALAAMEGQDYDLIISDIKMPEMNGIEFLEQIRRAGLTVPVILITAYASPEDAVAAMKGGAYDYITKPFNVAEIKEIIHSALLTVQTTKTQPAGKTFQGIIAQSPEMVKIFDLIRRIAPTHANVLIQGESGTGKELVAHAVHNLSKAADHSFVPIICNAIPENLFESEVFGHVKGSFTGAVSNKQGLFAEADRGSVFLDEVGELTPLVQTKLLRVIQEREFKPVGGSQNIKVNIRVITATNRDLEEEVIAGRFREDLFYRLSVVPIRVPPLRERKGDVPLLVDHFLKKYSRLFDKKISALSSYAMEVLMNYDFPGNVRELENIIERGVAMESSNIILPESLSIASHRQAAQGQQGAAADNDDFALGLEQAVENLEKRLLRKALAQAGGSKMKAAELLKISFRSLRYKIKKYGIDNDNAR